MIEPLGLLHGRATFSCEEPALKAMSTSSPLGCPANPFREPRLNVWSITAAPETRAWRNPVLDVGCPRERGDRRPRHRDGCQGRPHRRFPRALRSPGIDLAADSSVSGPQTLRRPGCSFRGSVRCSSRRWLFLIEGTTQCGDQIQVEPFRIVIRPRYGRAVIGIEMGAFFVEFRSLADVDHRFAQALRVSRFPVCA